MARMISFFFAFVAALFTATASCRAQAQGPYHDWAAVVVAGDWRATNGRDTQAFDNARRDVSAALVRAGFDSGNIRQLSSMERPEAGVMVLNGTNFVRAAREATAAGRAGCLFYITSHGSPQGAVMGRDGMIDPATLDQVLDQYCGNRPTVAVVSACFSGVFVPALQAENRMVLTAARPDRSSFGCSENDRYPYFDECILQSLPSARDFPALGQAAQTCVARREREERLTPASEPQLAVGAGVRPILARLAFPGRTPQLAQADEGPGGIRPAQPRQPAAEPARRPTPAQAEEELVLQKAPSRRSKGG